MSKVHQVSVNGKVAWKKGKVKESGLDLEFAGSDEHYMRFKVGSGTWLLEARTKDSAQ
jgi:hypothetical protein